MLRGLIPLQKTGILGARMANGLTQQNTVGQPLLQATPFADPKKKKPVMLVTTKTSTKEAVGVRISVATMMIGAIALGVSLFSSVGRNLPIANEGGGSVRAIIPGYPFSGADPGIFVDGELLVKFIPGADPAQVMNAVLTDPQVVLINQQTGQTLQSGTKESTEVLSSPERLSAFQSTTVSLAVDSIDAIFQAAPSGGQAVSVQSGSSQNLEQWKKVRLNDNRADLGALTQALRESGQVQYAEPNRAMRIAYAVNDPFALSSGSWNQPYADLWGLTDIKTSGAWDVVYATPGDMDGDGTFSQADIDLLVQYVFNGATPPNPVQNADVNGDGKADVLDVLALAHNIQDGTQPTSYGKADVVVAVVDTGLDPAHVDIADNVWVNTGEIAGNGVDDDGNGYIDDTGGYDFTTCQQFSYGCMQGKAPDNDPSDGYGHGTHVAGIIAAKANNGIGIAGVCPHCKVMPVKGLNDQGLGLTSDLAMAVQYAVLNGADVINASWGGIMQSQVLQDVFAFAWSRGVVAVAAAGNSNYDVFAFSPANIDTVVSVAAISPADTKVVFSNYGAPSAYSPGVSVSAPGGDSNGKSWRVIKNTEAYGDSYHTSSLTGAQARIQYLTQPVAQPYELRVGVGPDQGIITFSNLEKTYWKPFASFDAYAPTAGFTTLLLTIPQGYSVDAPAWMRAEVSGQKNPASVGTGISIDGGTFQDEDFDDSSYLYLDYDGDLSGPMNILSLRAGSTDLMRNGCCFIGGDYIRAGGTSMSAGFVSGLAGLLRSRFPDASVAEISGRIASSADPIDSLNPQYAGLLGAGRINAERALSGDSSPLLKVISVHPRTTMRRGQPAVLDVTVMNKGTIAHTVTASLTSSSSYVSIQDSSSSFGDINWADRITNTADPFTLTIAANTPVEVDSVPLTINFSAGGYTEEVTVDLPVMSALYQWSTALSGMNSRLAPAIENVTGDTRDEILIDQAGLDGNERGKGKVILLDSAGVPLPGWPVDPDPAKKQVISGTAIGDINGDGTKEIIVADVWTLDGYLPKASEIYAFDAGGHVLDHFPIVKEGTSGDLPKIALADLDGTPGQEIVVIASSYATVYKADGSELPGWPKALGGNEQPSQPAVGDINNDGSADIVFFTSSMSGSGQGHALSAGGVYLPGWPITGPGRTCNAPAVIADVDRVGTPEVLTTSCQYGNAGLFIYTSSGATLSSILGNDYQKYMGQTPVPADVDADGDLEIFIPSVGGGSIDGWHYDGTPVTGWPVVQEGATERNNNSIVAGDIDGDGDIEILLGTQTGLEASINAWHHDGRTVKGFPIKVPFTESKMRNGAMSLGDIDADGLTDLVVVRSADPSETDSLTQVTALEFSGSYRSGLIPWSSYQHDAARTGMYASSVCVDGTGYGTCSTSRQFCNNGTLTSDCRQCGFTCPKNLSCQKDGTCKATCQKIGFRWVCLEQF